MHRGEAEAADDDITLYLKCTNKLIFSKLVVTCHVDSIIEPCCNKEILVVVRSIQIFKVTLCLYWAVYYVCDFCWVFRQIFDFCTIYDIEDSSLSKGITNYIEERFYI
jgi:hypothetical protein